MGERNLLHGTRTPLAPDGRHQYLPRAFEENAEHVSIRFGSLGRFEEPPPGFTPCGQAAYGGWVLDCQEDGFPSTAPG